MAAHPVGHLLRSVLNRVFEHVLTHQKLPDVFGHIELHLGLHYRAVLHEVHRVDALFDFNLSQEATTNDLL